MTLFHLLVTLSELKPVLPGRRWAQQKPLYAWTAWRLRTSGRMRTFPGIPLCSFGEWARESLCLCTQFVQFVHRHWQTGPSNDGKSVTCVWCQRAAGVFFPWCSRYVLREQNSRQHREKKREAKHIAVCSTEQIQQPPTLFYHQEYFLQQRECVCEKRAKETDYSQTSSVITTYLHTVCYIVLSIVCHLCAARRLCIHKLW